MTKIEQIEATAGSRYVAGLSNITLPVDDILKMCAVIKAAESMGYDNSADSRKVFWAALQELNND